MLEDPCGVYGLPSPVCPVVSERRHFPLTRAGNSPLSTTFGCLDVLPAPPSRYPLPSFLDGPCRDQGWGVFEPLRRSGLRVAGE